MALLRYNGGKSKLVKKILPHILLSEKGVYCEPFVGGGSVGLAVAKKYPKVRIVLNDLDPSVYALWNLITHGSDQDFSTLRSAVLSCEPTIEQFIQLQATAPEDNVDLAFRTLFFNRTGFAPSNGKRPLGGWKQDEDGAINSRWNSGRLATEMTEARTLLRGRTTVFNEDFADVITLAEKDWTLYLDPPYYRAGNELYNISWTDSDHVRLRDLLATCPADWVLSYDMHPRVVELYKEHARTYPLQAAYSISKRREVEALIVPNKVTDTFVLPKNFLEFYQRYPNYVRLFVERKMRWSREMAREAPKYTVFVTTVEDYTQDLLMFLSSLPADSKYRAMGFTDPIQLFNPSLWGSVTSGKFFAYIKMILSNKFMTLRTHEYKDALPYADKVLGAANLTTDFDETSVDLQRFRSFIERERPVLLPTFDSFFIGDRGIESYENKRARLVNTLREYIRYGKVPKKRKEYKKRGAAA
jgi:DNA adenine methylase